MSDATKKNKTVADIAEAKAVAGLLQAAAANAQSSAMELNMLVDALNEVSKEYPDIEITFGDAADACVALDTAIAMLPMGARGRVMTCYMTKIMTTPKEGFVGMIPDTTDSAAMGVLKQLMELSGHLPGEHEGQAHDDDPAAEQSSPLDPPVSEK